MPSLCAASALSGCLLALCLLASGAAAAACGANCDVCSTATPPECTQCAAGYLFTVDAQGNVACAASQLTTTLGGFGVFVYILVIVGAVAGVVALVLKRKRAACFAPEPTDPPQRSAVSLLNELRECKAAARGPYSPNAPGPASDEPNAHASANPSAPEAAKAAALDFDAFDAEVNGAELEVGRKGLLKDIGVSMLLILVSWLLYVANTSTNVTLSSLTGGGQQTSVSAPSAQKGGSNAVAAIAIILSIIFELYTWQRARLWEALKAGFDASGASGALDQWGLVRHMNYVYYARQYAAYGLIFNAINTVAVIQQVSVNSGAPGTLSIIFQIVKTVAQLYLNTGALRVLYSTALKHGVYNLPLTDDIAQLESEAWWKAFITRVEDAGASLQDWVLDTHDEGDAASAGGASAHGEQPRAPIASSGAPANATGAWQPQPQPNGANAPYSAHSHTQYAPSYSSSSSEVHVDVSSQPVPMQPYGSSHEQAPSELEQQHQEQHHHLPPTIHSQHEHQSASGSHPMMYAAMGADQ
jgi:hypothetical protein